MAYNDDEEYILSSDEHADEIGGDADEKLREKKIKEEAAERKYYNLTAHRAWLWASLFIVAILCAGVFALAIKWFYYLLVFIIPEGFFGFKGQYEDILPDFLGGLCGIIIGASLDSFIISRLEHLKKYEAIVNVLNYEIQEIELALTGDEPMDRNMIIPLPNFESVFDSADMLALFYSIPRFFPFGKKITLVDEIRIITIALKNLNVYLKEIHNDSNAEELLASVHYYLTVGKGEEIADDAEDTVYYAVEEARKALRYIERFKSVTIKTKKHKKVA